MPFPNEHSCRLRDPGDFQGGRFRRIRQGKLEIIIGRLKGEASTSAQAFRYPKGDWTVAEARAHCEGEGGKMFEPAGDGPARDEPDPRLDQDQRPPAAWWDNCIAKAEGFADDPSAFCGALWANPGDFPGGGSKLRQAFGQAGARKDAEHGGEDFVRSCVASLQGIAENPTEACARIWKNLPGAFHQEKADRRSPGRDFRGVLEWGRDAIRVEGGVAIIPAVFTLEGVQNGGLKTREELTRSWRWLENRPVTDDHPAEPGHVVSRDQVRGVVRNVRFREEDAAIVGDIHIFLDEKGRALLAEIERGEKREVSVGFWFDREEKTGDFKGEKFDHVQRNLLWDHVAILKDGACSQAMGCGLKI